MIAVEVDGDRRRPGRAAAATPGVSRAAARAGCSSVDSRRRHGVRRGARRRRRARAGPGAAGAAAAPDGRDLHRRATAGARWSRRLSGAVGRRRAGVIHDIGYRHYDGPRLGAAYDPALAVRREPARRLRPGTLGPVEGDADAAAGAAGAARRSSIGVVTSVHPRRRAADRLHRTTSFDVPGRGDDLRRRPGARRWSRATCGSASLPLYFSRPLSRTATTSRRSTPRMAAALFAADGAAR